MNISAILLAAGSSTRFGEANKLLALLDGEPIISHTARLLSNSQVNQITVVTGPDAEQIAQALTDWPCRFVANKQYLQGMGSSIAKGINSLDKTVDGAMIVPGDMPFLSPALLNQLIDNFQSSEAEHIVYPTNEAGQQGNPVLWPRRCFKKLIMLNGHHGAKSLISSDDQPAVKVTTHAGWLQDIDTKAQLALADKHFGA